MKPLKPRAFTLLEVMVAVAILGLALTVILSAQTGLYASSGYAQHLSIATGLARCRMTEVEERLFKLGFPELDTNDDGACCDDSSRQDFTCKWKIEKVILPEMNMSSGDGGSMSALSALTGGLGAAPGAGTTGVLGGTSGPLGALSQLASGAAFSTDAGMSGIASQLGAGASAASGLAPMAMSFVYPTLKPLLEASIRKITVSVNWHDGLRERDLSIVEFITHPSRGFPPTSDGGVPGMAGTSSTGVTGIPAGTSKSSGMGN